MAVLLLLLQVSGGLFSVAYTGIAQGLVGWTGAAALTFYLIVNADPKAPPPSIGFPGYIYPDSDICNMYEGVPCENDPSLCCYNTALWCPSDDNCRTDNGAYPIGDQPIFTNQMSDYLALSPL